jgi:hypothetical protein
MSERVDTAKGIPMSGRTLNSAAADEAACQRRGVEGIGDVSLFGMLAWAAINAIYLIAVGLSGLLG